MPDTDLWSLIFEAGFSTAKEVTQLSGRGVGMDVVRRNIGALGGSVFVSSPGARERPSPSSCPSRSPSSTG